MSPTLAPPPPARPQQRRPPAKPASLKVCDDGPAEGGSVTVPASAHTLDGFREWVRGNGVPDGMKAAYWDGEVLLKMTNERFRSHTRAKTLLAAALVRWFDESGLGIAATDGPLLVNADADLSTGPDAVAILWSTLEAGRVTLGEPIRDGQESVELAGSPDLVAEVVSPGSVTKDTRVLAEKYFVAGVAEYWILDAIAEPPSFGVMVRGEDEFVPAKESDGWQQAGVLNRDVRMTTSEGRLGFHRIAFEDREA